MSALEPYSSDDVKRKKRKNEQQINELQIANTAYELVKHAIHLVEGGKYFDEGIEILRQAIGLYSQINRADEIKAINEKISEVYLLKEQAFREM